MSYYVMYKIIKTGDVQIYGTRYKAHTAKKLLESVAKQKIALNNSLVRDANNFYTFGTLHSVLTIERLNEVL